MKTYIFMRFNHPRHMRLLFGSILFALFTGQLSAQAQGLSVNQPILGHRSVQIITVGNLQFKDLNRNNRLDPYEDWRLDPEKRALDLRARMTLEQKAGFMLISTTRTAALRAARAREYCCADTTRLTGSYSAMVLATVANTCCAGAPLSRQLSGRSGQAIQTCAWGAHSAGMA